MQTKERWIPTLDGWRAIAVLMVIVCHEIAGRKDIGKFWDLIAGKLGPLGVSIFFAISGYLICTLLLIESDKGRISLRAFYKRRFFRILPPALVYLAFVGAASLLGLLPVSAMDILSCIFLFANYWDKSWYVEHFWSLSIEEHFYLMWPALLAFAGWRRAAAFSVGGILLVSAWRIYAGETRFFSSVNPYQRTDMVLDAFFAPCLLAIAIHYSARVRETAQRFATPWLTLGGMILLLVLTVGGVQPALKKTFQALILPIVVVSTVLQPSTWIGRILEHRVLAWIGRVSYSLYLWQELWMSPFHSWASLPFRMAGLFTVASASYYFVERPMIAYGRRFLAGREPAKAKVKAAAGGA
ncbi:MAG TPA: acyltransferase [Bryobacteraceae bacterium]|nr:acyltransferase [Bryobacteraceae bacterium]